MLERLTTLPRSKTDHGIAYHRCGDGPPVLLIHGVGLRSESWFQQIAALAQSSTVYALDIPGHGDSAPLQAGHPTLSRYVDCVAHFVAQEIGEPAVLIGHSLGALLALNYAVRSPHKCLGVVALNAVHRRSAQASAAVLARAAAIRQGNASDDANALRRWFGDRPAGHEQAMSELCARWLGEIERNSYADAYSIFAGADGLSDTELSALTMPCLFLTGENDANSSPAMSRRMARLAPRGRATIIDGARHLAQLTHAGEVNNAVLEFLAALTVQSQSPAAANRVGGN